MSSIDARMRGLSLNDSEPPAAELATTTVTPQPDDTPSPRRPSRRPRAISPVQVNPRPLPTAEECRAARQRCMYYGFYAGELAIQRMLINAFPEQLGGRDPFDPGLFLMGLAFVRDITKRPDIGVHIAYISKKNKEVVPCIGAEAGAATYIVSLFPLEKEAYMNRITQESVDMLEEMVRDEAYLVGDSTIG